MFVSPDIYNSGIIVKYKVVALTPATVIVTLLSVSDKRIYEKLTIPEKYNGSIALWSKEKENYFFAFKNAPHNVIGNVCFRCKYNKSTKLNLRVCCMRTT